jgi:4a-hydroxytetrahydrobiopterin dehydratase
MSERITKTQFAERFDLPDWRLITHTIEAHFLASSFADAANFVGEIATASDAARHHPDVDLRYPGHVRVQMFTHDVPGLSVLDAKLARVISNIAASRGITPLHGRAQRFDLAIDVMDIELVLPFWKAILGYVEVRTEPGKPAEDLIDPRGYGPPLWFQQMDAPRPQRNRMHVDVQIPHDEVATRLAAAVAAGGQLIDESHARSFWVLADPEGNEICICTSQDRD